MNRERTAKITYVDLDDACDMNGEADVVLTVYLSNNQSVTLSLSGKENDVRFSDILTGGNRSKPKTDGTCVYWTDGLRLSLDEIIEMVVE